MGVVTRELTQAPAPDMTAWAQQMRERLVARAEETETLRRLPQATIDEAVEAGFFGMLAPSRFGGMGAGLAEFLEVVRILGRGCVSSAWTLSFLANHAWLMGKLDPEFQMEILPPRGYALVAAPLAPTGAAVPVEGGFKVKGRWEWATAIWHSDWVMVNCMVPDAPVPRFCVLPVSEVTVVDVWRTSGMVGTGSNIVVVEDVFVPAHRTIDGLALMDPPGLALHAEPTLRYPLTSTLAVMAATPALGAAEQALEDFTDRMKQKLLAYSGGTKQGEQPSIHIRIGEAAATLQAARAVWKDCIATLERHGPLGGAMPIELRAEARLGSANVVRLACEVIDGLCAAAGASAYFLSSPLQRALRDVQMMRGHVVFDWDRAAQIGGKIRLGLPSTPMDML